MSNTEKDFAQIESEKAAAEAAERAAQPEVKHKRKALELHLPYVVWGEYLRVSGKITRKFSSDTSYGARRNIEIELDAPLSFNKNDGELVDLVKGDKVNVGSTASLAAVMTLDVNTSVEIICKGKKEVGMNESWDFDVYYD